MVMQMQKIGSELILGFDVNVHVICKQYMLLPWNPFQVHRHTQTLRVNKAAVWIMIELQVGKDVAV